MANYNLTQTGAEVQVILDRVTAGYIYMGTADLTTTPDTTNPNVCYLLTAVGTYTNFGNIQHASGIGIAIWNGTAWSYQNVPSSAVVTTDATPTANSTNPVQSGAVYSITSAITGTTKNVIDPSAFNSYDNITYESGIVTATGKALHVATSSTPYTLYTNSFKANTKYTFSFDAKTDANVGSTGSGIRVVWFYTDNTTSNSLYVPNSQTSFSKVSTTCSANKTVRGIGFTYGANAYNIWYLKNLQLEEGEIATNYVPPISAVDYIARDTFSKYVEGEGKLGIGIVNGYKKMDNQSGTFNPTYTQNSYFPLQDFQETLRGASLYGIKVNVSTVGTLTIVKATGVKTNNCVMTIIKTFTIVAQGWNVLLFDAPVILSSEESIGIGIATDTARLVTDSVTADNAIKTDYLYYTSDSWVVFNHNMLVDFLGVPKNDAQEANSKVSGLIKTNAFSGYNPFRFGGQFFAHMFINKIAQDSTNVIIPSESLADIRAARRMGFNVIEANVQTTSDGKYIVIHGNAGAFGYEVTDLNGDFTYASTAINSKTLDWIKTNIRYRSDIARYRTAIPTLEEFLTECRISGMIPMSQASDSAMVSVLDKYMGYGNYIAYNGTRALTNAPILTYKSLTTKEEILAKCRSYGVPYIYSMGNLAAFTDEELADIVQSLHAEGYMIATAYVNFASGNRAIKLGFDIIASDSFVPHIDCGNICNYGADATFSDFNVTNATINDSVITMTGLATITPKNIADSVFVGVGELRVVYNGTIVVNLRGANQTMTSDGVNEQVFSTYYINEVPTFTILGADSSTTISDITFRASKV